jgi:ABC-type uncharacterized transport system substrate-binding protein
VVRELMRNSFFGLLLSAMILALSLSAEAQQPKKVPRIGYLTLRSAPSDQDEAFKQGLRELGWVDSQNIAIEYRWAAGKVDRLPVLAEELVGLKVDLIVAWATPAVNAAKNATRTIPIVMGPTADPVGSGFVASLSRPGGNITGVSLMAPELAGKRLELLREVVPRLNRIAFLAHGGDPAHTLFVKEAQERRQEPWCTNPAGCSEWAGRVRRRFLSDDQRASGCSGRSTDL